eukprot:gene8312-biopygen7908
MELHVPGSRVEIQLARNRLICSRPLSHVERMHTQLRHRHAAPRFAAVAESLGKILRPLLVRGRSYWECAPAVPTGIMMIPNDASAAHGVGRMGVWYIVTFPEALAAIFCSFAKSAAASTAAPHTSHWICTTAAFDTARGRVQVQQTEDD